MANVKGKVSIPMTDFEPRQEPRQEPYAPGYSSSLPYTPQTYPPPPQAYPQQSYGPEGYSPEPYLSGPLEPYTSQDGGCCDPSLDPPPYSCQEVPCDRTDPICMVNNPPVVVAGIFSSHPASTICPCCRQIITTEVVYRVGPLTYAVCSGLCVVGSVHLIECHLVLVLCENIPLFSQCDAEKCKAIGDCPDSPCPKEGSAVKRPSMDWYLGCCLIPFFTNCCKDVDHYCPNCQYHIYRYKRL